MSDHLTDTENISVGVIAALLVGITLQPTLYWKNARAIKAPFTLNPRIIYRGTLAACLNECQMLGLQFGVTGFFNKCFKNMESHSSIANSSCGSYSASKDAIKSTISNSTAELMSSALGGLFPTILTCPIELVMIQQQKYGGSFYSTSLHIYRTYGILSHGLIRGLLPTIGRDTICVMGMLGITPIVQDYLISTHHYSSELAGVYASIIGGCFSALPSHPFDTIKTCMQGDVKQVIYTRFSTTAMLLYQEGGISRLYRGCFWRSFNIIGTVYIANECRVRLPSLLFT